jgi:hypothetical protein
VEQKPDARCQKGKKPDQDKVFNFFGFFVSSFLPLASCFLLLTLAGCNPTYPKAHIEDSVRKLFRKELKAEAQSTLIGKTLYVGFQIEGIMSNNAQLSKQVIEQLENAMISISRIALSTDAEVDYTVIEATDPLWGVQIRVVRRMQDLKDLFYWGISKPDYDDRLILEIKRPRRISTLFETTAGSTPSVAEVDEPEEKEWHDLTLDEFMAQLAASRVYWSMRSNPFNILIQIEVVRSKMENKVLYLTVRGLSTFDGEGADLEKGLFKNILIEQVSQIEDKYVLRESAQRKQDKGIPAPKSWVDEVIVQDAQHKIILRIPRDEWTKKQHKGVLTRK